MSMRRRLRPEREQLELFPGRAKDSLARRPTFDMTPASRVRIKLAALRSLLTTTDICARLAREFPDGGEPS
jgi:hypothetical protein